MSAPSITCPVCRRTSYNPNDVREGFCGYCHAWTARPDLDTPEGHPMTEQHPDEGSMNPSAISWARHWPADDEARVTQVEGAQLEQPRPSVLDELRELIDVPPLTAPQAQGDVLVLPWLDTTSPAMRAERVAATVALAVAGCAVTEDGSHVLLPNSPKHCDGVRYAYVNKGHTLGTLVVEPGHAARLSHHEHGDLLIGPGVYALHQQRRWVQHTPAPVAD